MPDAPPVVDMALSRFGTCAAFADDRAVCWHRPQLRDLGGRVETVHGGPAVTRERPHADDIFELSSLRRR